MVERYIKYLLFNYDCVVIPDLGGFITSYNTAEVHPVRHTFLPPSKGIAFNERLKNDDGLLASTIAKFENISMEDAYFQIKGFVFDIRGALKEQNKCYIKEIGTLFINHEYVLQFEQDSKTNYENESFGLPELFFKPIIRENVATRLVAASKDRAAATASRVPAPARRRNGSSVWTYILAIPVLAVIALVAVSVYFVAFTDGKQGIAGFNPLQKNSVVANPEVEAIADASSEQNPSTQDTAVAEEQESIADVATTPSQTPKALPKVHQESSMMDGVTSNPVRATTEAEIIVPTDGSKRYYVIVGSFSKPENAASLRERLASSENTAKIIHPSDNRGLYKVSLADYENLTQAQAKLNEAQTRFKESLWVCKY